MNELEHKYFELLRHHVTNQIKDSAELISSSSEGIPGYAVGVVFDLAIAVLFSDVWTAEGVLLSHRVVFVLVLLAAYIAVSYIWNSLSSYVKSRAKLAGSDDASGGGARDLVDLFDNDVSDALLIGEYYFGLYVSSSLEQVRLSNIPKIYLFESLHYLEKAVVNFEKVYAKRGKCLGDEGFHSGKVAIYRAKTFAAEAQVLYQKLESAFATLSGDKPGEKELLNLHYQIMAWKI